uniref:Uncharacterized protein n=1 Tax=Romanomermis culicivorax TaxID=13658 RepID=A0A915JQ66_ROMCU
MYNVYLDNNCNALNHPWEKLVRIKLLWPVSKVAILRKCNNRMLRLPFWATTIEVSNNIIKASSSKALASGCPLDFILRQASWHQRLLTFKWFYQGDLDDANYTNFISNANFKSTTLQPQHLATYPKSYIKCSNLEGECGGEYEEELYKDPAMLDSHLEEGTLQLSKQPLFAASTTSAHQCQKLNMFTYTSRISVYEQHEWYHGTQPTKVPKISGFEDDIAQHRGVGEVRLVNDQSFISRKGSGKSKLPFVGFHCSHDFRGTFGLLLNGTALFNIA